MNGHLKHWGWHQFVQNDIWNLVGVKLNHLIFGIKLKAMFSPGSEKQCTTYNRLLGRVKPTSPAVNATFNRESGKSHIGRENTIVDPMWTSELLNISKKCQSILMNFCTIIGPDLVLVLSHHFGRDFVRVKWFATKHYAVSDLKRINSRSIFSPTCHISLQ